MRRLLACTALLAAALPACSDDSATDAGDADVPDDVPVDVPADVEDVEAEADAEADAADVPPEVPPRICREPAPLGSGPHFYQATLEAGFDRDQLYVLGNVMASADLDGDGYPDLLIHRGAAGVRDDPETDPPQAWQKRVLMNRPGTGGRTFVDATVESEYGRTRDGSGLGRAASFAVVADADNDGDNDVFSATMISDDTGVVDPGDRSELLLNDGSGRFTPADSSAISTGPDEHWPAHAATFLDADRDGRLDLFVGFQYRRYGYPDLALQDRLYHGAGDGTFTDVTDAAGLTTHVGTYDEGTNHRPTDGTTACDIDGDGDDDLVVAAYGRQLDLLWENQGDGTFVEIGREVGYASDGRDDYTDNEMYRCYCQSNPGVCDPAPPAPRISCASTSWNPGSDDQPYRLGGNTFSTICFDADNDGDFDLFNAGIRHWWAGSSSDPSELLEQVPAPDARGWTLQRPGNETNGLERDWRAVDWNEGDLTVSYVDFDNDGWKDVYLASSDYPDTRGFLFRRLPAGGYEELGRAAGIGHPGANAQTWADFDRDGDLDLIVGSSTMRSCCGWTEPEVHYYRNDVGHLGNWVQLVLEGDPAAGANRSAVGARVTVVAGDLTQVQQVSAGHGHYGLQNDLVLHFGLGAACDVDSVEVRWPDAAGTTERWEDLRGNYRIRLRQGSPHAWYE
ncbi:MAG: CRTAC1 family protein [Deltaproteobacteria bacterium]|nr:CRTAC1 family protein [Deltaproteobacteria bacterium]